MCVVWVCVLVTGFLAGPTERTTQVFSQVEDLLALELEKGGAVMCGVVCVSVLGAASAVADGTSSFVWCRCGGHRHGDAIFDHLARAGLPRQGEVRLRVAVHV